MGTAVAAGGGAGRAPGQGRRLTGVLVPRPQVVGGGDDDEPHEAGEEVEERVAAVVVLELLPRHGRSAPRRPPTPLTHTPLTHTHTPAPAGAGVPGGGPVSPSRLARGRASR